MDDFKWLNSSYCPVLRQLESASMKVRDPPRDPHCVLLLNITHDVHPTLLAVLGASVWLHCLYLQSGFGVHVRESVHGASRLAIRITSRCTEWEKCRMRPSESVPCP